MADARPRAHPLQFAQLNRNEKGVKELERSVDRSISQSLNYRSIP